MDGRPGQRLFVVALILLATALPLPASAQAADWDVPGGHFFTQTGAGTGKGYVVSDADGVQFWKAFRDLGGVEVVGYPVTQRFMHGGFVTQAMQKAVFQWRPESSSVAFVNVFDDLAAAGKDQFLLEARSTPRATAFPEEAGKPFEEAVRIRQAALDARPAMKGMYFAAGNPVLQYGLPTSQVADMGNHYAVRMQRAVIQEWKQDVPWAKAGQATVANGGDIGKEAVLWPAAALPPTDPSGAGAPAAAAPRAISSTVCFGMSPGAPTTGPGVACDREIPANAAMIHTVQIWDLPRTGRYAFSYRWYGPDGALVGESAADVATATDRGWVTIGALLRAAITPSFPTGTWRVVALVEGTPAEERRFVVRPP